ncbi:hypothetical protein D9M70_478540 [compost metagenome]
MLRRERDRVMESGAVQDGVVGRHHHQDHVFAPALRQPCGHGQRGRGIAPRGLDHQARLDTGLGQLLGSAEAVFLAAGDDGFGHHLAPGVEAGQAAQCRLQQRVGADQVDQLLGIVLARQRPQARARAAGQHHRRQPQPLRPRTGAVILFLAVGLPGRHRPRLHLRRLQHGQALQSRQPGARPWRGRAAPAAMPRGTFHCNRVTWCCVAARPQLSVAALCAL